MIRKTISKLALTLFIWSAKKLHYNVMTFREDHFDGEEQYITAVCVAIDDEHLMLHAHEIVKNGL